MRDLFSNLGAHLALASAVQSASIQGPAIDLQGYEGACFVVASGAIASAGDFSLKIQESDTDQTGDFTDAPASVVKSNAPATLEASSSYRLGYTGFKRYVRLDVTKAGGTSIALGAVAVLGRPHSAPVS